MPGPDNKRSAARRGVHVALAIYLASVLVLFLVPPARTLHAESAAVVAGVAFLTTGLVSIRYAGARASGAFGNVAGLIATTLLPFLLLALSTALHPGCWSLDGVLLYWAFVLPASLFGAAGAYVITALFNRYRRLTFVAAGLLVAVGSVAFDLGWHPQFYSYSHVFGGVVGPVYDGWTGSRFGLFTFRIVTLLWCAALWASGRDLRRRGNLRSRLVLAVSLAALVTAYACRGVLGFNTTYGSLRSALPAVHETEHFAIHYDDTARLPVPIRLIAERQEYEYARLSAVLREQVGQTIAVYLYPDERTRARISGAGTTSVTPVWLNTPQIHMLALNHETSFAHELVHVMSREFGMPVLNASTRIGLVEGLAVALEPPSMSYHPHDRVRAAVESFDWDQAELRVRSRRTMSPFGFWSDRGAVAYAISGSFVDFFIGRYGIDALKALYRTGDFRSSAGVSADDVHALWAEWLIADSPDFDSRIVDRVAAEFAVASLFERTCPHVVPDALVSLRRGDEGWEQWDTTAAILHWQDAAADGRIAEAAEQRLALAALHRGDRAAASQLMAGSDSTGSWLGSILAADLLAIAGQGEAAGARYDTLIERTASLSRAASVALRASIARTPAAIASLYSEPQGNPENPELHWGAARAALRDGRYDEAVRHLRLATTNVQRASADRQEGGSAPHQALVEWYRMATIGQSSEAYGSWHEAETAWRAAETVAATPSLSRFPYAGAHARYRAERAVWLAAGPHQVFHGTRQ